MLNIHKCAFLDAVCSHMDWTTEILNSIAHRCVTLSVCVCRLAISTHTFKSKIKPFIHCIQHLSLSFPFLFSFSHLSLSFHNIMDHTAHQLDDRKSWHGDEDLEELSFIFKTYKIRFFGLAVIALSNIASSLNWLAVAPVPDYASQYFNNIGLTTINWFSNVFMLTYLVAGPASSWVYEHWSIKMGVSN